MEQIDPNFFLIRARPEQTESSLYSSAETILTIELHLVTIKINLMRPTVSVSVGHEKPTIRTQVRILAKR